MAVDKPASATGMLTRAALEAAEQPTAPAPDAAMHVRMTRLEAGLKALHGNVEELRSDIAAIRQDIRGVLQADVQLRAEIENRRQERWDRVATWTMEHVGAGCAQLVTTKGMVGMFALLAGLMLLAAGYGDDLIQLLWAAGRRWGLLDTGILPAGDD